MYEFYILFLFIIFVCVCGSIKSLINKFVKKEFADLLVSLDINA